MCRLLLAILFRFFLSVLAEAIFIILLLIVAFLLGFEVNHADSMISAALEVVLLVVLWNTIHILKLFVNCLLIIF